MCAVKDLSGGTNRRCRGLGSLPIGRDIREFLGFWLGLSFLHTPPSKYMPRGQAGAVLHTLTLSSKYSPGAQAGIALHTLPSKYTSGEQAGDVESEPSWPWVWNICSFRLSMPLSASSSCTRLSSTQHNGYHAGCTQKGTMVVLFAAGHIPPHWTLNQEDIQEGQLRCRLHQAGESQEDIEEERTNDTRYRRRRNQEDSSHPRRSW